MDIRGYRTAALRTHYQQHRQFPAQNRGIMGHVQTVSFVPIINQVK